MLPQNKFSLKYIENKLQFARKANYYIAQATSGEIACSDQRRRVTCWSVIIRIGPVRITGFVSHFVYKRTTKGNFEKPQKFNQFSKLSTKICTSRTMKNLKESFKREFQFDFRLIPLLRRFRSFQLQKAGVNRINNITNMYN